MKRQYFLITGFILLIGNYSLYANELENIDVLGSISSLKNNSFLKKESISKKESITRKKSPSERFVNQENVPSQLKLKEVQPSSASISRVQLNKKDRSYLSNPKLNIGKTQAENTIYRLLEPSLSQKNSSFSIYDAAVELDFDNDGDGYFSEFTLSFDADFYGSSAQVYAEIYIRLEGGAWRLFDTTEVFTIFSDSAQDTYDLSVALNFDYPTGSYDFLIDLYEDGFSGIVATADPVSDSDLFDLPLEDKEHELSNSTQITYVASELSFDEDSDGYYTRLTLEYDIETLISGINVYAEVVITDSESLEQSRLTTERFILGTQTELVDIDFYNDYFPGLYNIEIRLIDSLTNQTIAYAAQDFSSLTKLPIESQDYDAIDDAGSFGVLLGWLILILIVIRFVVDDKKRSEERGVRSEKYNWIDSGNSD